MSKKYELIEDDFIEHDGRRLYRIRALRDFGSVKAGDIGGYVESEKNLNHEGNAWVSDEAWVYGNAWVGDSARVCGDAKVYGDANVSGHAQVLGNARVGGYSRVIGYSHVDSPPEAA